MEVALSKHKCNAVSPTVPLSFRSQHTSRYCTSPAGGAKFAQSGFKRVFRRTKAAITRRRHLPNFSSSSMVGTSLSMSYSFGSSMFFNGGSCNAPGAKTNRVSNDERRERRRGDVESKGPNESQKWCSIGLAVE